MADEKKIILEVQNLTKYFDTPKGKLHAVDGVSFQIEEGKTLGVVGESGCGKSTTGRTLLKLTEPTSGKIIFDGEDITRYNRSRMRALRTKMQMIFQDPFSSLDPRQSIMQLISEPIKEHKLLSRKEEIEKRTLELMDIVGLARRFVNSYPHELDGGRRQRIGIARALLCQAEYIIFDEATSSVDVESEQEIWNCIDRLALTRTLIIISHRLSTIRSADCIYVLDGGEIAESGRHEELMQRHGLYHRLVTEQAQLEGQPQPEALAERGRES